MRSTRRNAVVVVYLKESNNDGTSPYNYGIYYYCRQKKKFRSTIAAPRGDSPSKTNKDPQEDLATT